MKRRADGSGIRLDKEAGPLAADRLPPLALREHWPTTRDAELVVDHLDRLAPQLMTLQRPFGTARIRLKRAACRQTWLVDSMHSLYPCVPAPEVIRAARVEARLRRSNVTRPETDI